MTVRRLIPLLALVFSLGIFTDRARAASSETCNVTQAGYNNDPTTGNKEFIISCSDGTGYFSIIAGVPACSSYYSDIDTVKIYESMATAARLSAHSLSIYYNFCPGTQTRSITSVNLN